MCLHAGAMQAAEPVHVALGDEGLGAATLIVGSKGQYFSRAGLEVRLDAVQSDQAAESAVAEGRAEFGTARLSGSFFAYAAMHDLRVIAPEYNDRTGFPSTVMVVASAARKDGLRGPADLARRRIGLLSLDTPARYALSKAAERYNVPDAAIHLQHATDEAQLRFNLADGRVDAAIVSFDLARAWLRTQHDLTIVRLSDFVQWQDGVIFARALTLTKKVGEVDAFMRAYREAVADYDLTFQQRDDEGTALPGAHFRPLLMAIAAQAGMTANEAAYALPYCDPLARLDTIDLGQQLFFWQNLGTVGQQVKISDIAHKY